MSVVKIDELPVQNPPVQRAIKEEVHRAVDWATYGGHRAVVLGARFGHGAVSLASKAGHKGVELAATAGQKAVGLASWAKDKVFALGTESKSVANEIYNMTFYPNREATKSCKVALLVVGALAVGGIAATAIVVEYGVVQLFFALFSKVFVIDKGYPTEVIEDVVCAAGISQIAIGAVVGVVVAHSIFKIISKVNSKIRADRQKMQTIEGQPLLKTSKRLAYARVLEDVGNGLRIVGPPVFLVYLTHLLSWDIFQDALTYYNWSRKKAYVGAAARSTVFTAGIAQIAMGSFLGVVLYSAANIAYQKLQAGYYTQSNS